MFSSCNRVFLGKLVPSRRRENRKVMRNPYLVLGLAATLMQFVRQEVGRKCSRRGTSIYRGPLRCWHRFQAYSLPPAVAAG
jgi:hypothetical protein